MSFYLDNVRDLKEENASRSGPSRSSRSSKASKKSKIKRTSSKQNSIELGNSLVNLNIYVGAVKTQKDEKNKYKAHGLRRKPSKGSKSTNIRQLLSERLRMYSLAEHKAREMGQIKKARELNREVQLLNALITHHESGNIIDAKNIPPEIRASHYSKLSIPQIGVTFKESDEVAVIPFTDLDSNTSSNSDTEASMEKILGILRLRRDQYKISVVQNKTVGNVTRALEHLNIIKMFDSVIRHIEMGEKVDLNELPGPPECPICHINTEETSDDDPKSVIFSESSNNEEQNISFSTILQELQQRLRAYEIMKINAKRENNLGETLRLDQILKLYREAIKLHRTKKNVPIDELPSPPGFPSLHNLRTR